MNKETVHSVPEKSMYRNMIMIQLNSVRKERTNEDIKRKKKGSKQTKYKQKKKEKKENEIKNLHWLRPELSNHADQTFKVQQFKFKLQTHKRVKECLFNMKIHNMQIFRVRPFFKQRLNSEKWNVGYITTFDSGVLASSVWKKKRAYPPKSEHSVLY